MDRFQRILVGITNTEADLYLLRYAALVARLSGAGRVCFAHVLPHGRDGLAGEGVIPARERTMAALEALVGTHFTGLAPETQTVIDVLKAPLVNRSLDYAVEQEVDLVLVGHRRSLRLLARRLAMSAPCSVWMVPEKSPAAFHRILVPVDFSPHSAHALRLAVSLAHRGGAVKCCVLHVTPTEPALLHEYPDTFSQDREREELRQLVASVGAPDVQFELLFETGRNVPETILRVAAEQQADLIVIGTRGHGASAAVRLGSAAEHTIIHSRFPVLAVKEFGARLGVLESLLEKSCRPGMAWSPPSISLPPVHKGMNR